MAATAAPYGAIPVGTLSASGSFSHKTRAYKIASGYATAIFAGDFVKGVTAGVIEKDTGTTALTPIGIFMGCMYTDPNTGQFLTSPMWPASTVASDAVALVIDDPNVLFQMQGDGTIAQTALFGNFAVVQTAGSTSIKRSKNAVDADSVADTNTLPLRLVEFVESDASTAGDAYTDVIVKFNVGHQLTNTTGLA